ncbi:MAG: hypothetical protein M3R51_02480 [Candidatus Eremiobacteraeota bacterium]|nr:hypothetical protein [Candidatus Eremiobacteraeota bacterium]
MRGTVLNLFTGTLLACVMPAAAAGAQTLQHLSIREFSLSADTATPKTEEPFHLIVVVRVAERSASFTNLDLPVLAELELIGDERHVAAGSDGAVYREVIGVVAHHSGDIHVAPATIDAIDPRDNRAKRYFSNDLTLHVTAGAIATFGNARSAAGNLARSLLDILGFIVGLAAAMFVIFTVLRRRRAVANVAPPALEPAAPIEVRPRDALCDGLLALRAERSRAIALAVRTLARRAIGAGDNETLGDVLQRPQAYDPKMRDVLIALERAAFTYDADFAGALEDAIGSLERATA